MANRTIYIAEYCHLHNVDRSFIESLHHEGLIHLTADADTISDDELDTLELFTRLHQQLGINAGGLDAIAHLLDRIREMQIEMSRLRARLSIYEEL